MGGSMMHQRDLHKFGRELGEELDALRDDRAVAHARARLFEGAAKPVAAPRRFAFAGFALAGAAAIAAFALLGRGGGAPDASTAAVPAATAAQTLRFDDGSTFEAAAGARVRTLATTPGNTALELTEGRLMGTVAAGSSWRVETPLGELRVGEGSRFDATVSAGRLTVVAHEGGVSILSSGAVLAEVAPKTTVHVELVDGKPVATVAR